MTDTTLISPDLLIIMQCPQCGGELAEHPEPPALICCSCDRAYPVRDGIPNMLLDDSDIHES